MRIAGSASARPVFGRSDVLSYADSLEVSVKFTTDV